MFQLNPLQKMNGLNSLKNGNNMGYYTYYQIAFEGDDDKVKAFKDDLLEFSKDDDEEVDSYLEELLSYSGVEAKLYDLEEWIDFVCSCRDGGTEYMQYDLISGKVANDKVFRVVDMYHTGVWDKARALKEIKVYPSYDQSAFITQKAIDQLLVFHSFEGI